MIDIGEVVHLIRTLPRREFSERMRGYYLMTSENPRHLPRSGTTDVVAFPGGGMPMRDPKKCQLFRVEKGRDAALADRVSIGRAESCDVQLADPSVSDRHAAIHLLERQQFELSDLASTNGTRLNGRLLRRATQLNVGDVITLGNLPLAFLGDEDLFDLF